MKGNAMRTAAVAASALLLAFSCTKQDAATTEGKAKVFTATIEQSQTKTTLEYDSESGQYIVNWDSGDLININGGAIYSANPDTRKSGYAEFTLVKGQDPTPPYAAVYPSSLINPKDSSFYFPQVQQYEAGRCNAPMVARSENEKLEFHNICGVICFSLTGAGSVRRIDLSSASHPLWGRIGIDINTWVAEIEEDKSQIIGGMGMGMGMVNPTNSVALDCGEDGVQLNPEKPTDFYLYLPAGEYGANDLDVCIASTDGGECCKTAEGDVKVERNRLYNFVWDVEFTHSASADTVHIIDPPIAAEDALLPGEFTVDADGTKVKFTRGNLYWSGNAWALEENQYEYPVNMSYIPNHVNLLLWTNAAHISDSYAVSRSAVNSPYNELFCDIDHQIEVASTKSLFALSWSQWEFLLFKRNCQNKFVKISFTTYGRGLLLLPDVLMDEKVLKLLQVIKEMKGSVNGDKANFPIQNLPDDTINVFQQAGCVFLPASGIRQGGNRVLFGEGHYWAAKPAKQNCAELIFSNQTIEFREDGIKQIQNNAASIRLVQKIDAIPAPPAAEQDIVLGE